MGRKAAWWSQLLGTWSDRIMLLLLLLGIAWLWQSLLQHGSGKGAMVKIYHARTLLAAYPLYANQEVHFNAQGDLGISEVLIAKGRVRMLHSSCPTQACVLSGEHHRIGDSIVCVPNRILVVIEGQGQQALDAITQ